MKKQKKISFYLPILYTCNIRFKSKSQIISWIFIYILPVFFSYLFIPGVHLSYKNILLISTGILSIYNLYEVGYIYNDTETIKKEINPTLRLSGPLLKYYYNRKHLIYTIRLTISLLLSYIIYSLSQSANFIIATYFMLFIFYVYNKIRNRANLPLHFLLVTVRFCSIPLLFTTTIPYLTSLYLILLFPFINTLERCSEKKVSITKIPKSTHQ